MPHSGGGIYGYIYIPGSLSEDDDDATEIPIVFSGCTNYGTVVSDKPESDTMKYQPVYVQGGIVGEIGDSSEDSKVVVKVEDCTNESTVDFR